MYADIDVEATRCFDPLLQAAQNAHVAVLLGEELSPRHDALIDLIDRLDCNKI